MITPCCHNIRHETALQWLAEEHSSLNPDAVRRQIRPCATSCSGDADLPR